MCQKKCRLSHCFSQSLVNIFFAGITVIVVRAYRLPWAVGVALAVADVLVLLVVLYLFRELRGKDEDQAWRPAH